MYVNWCEPTITNCTFTGNVSAWYGGGICSENGCTATLTNCTFNGNVASRNPFGSSFTQGLGGGGMYWAGHGEATLTNCTFFDNEAGTSGGAVFVNENESFLPTVTIANTILVGNDPNDCSAESVSLVSRGYNLESGTSCGCVEVTDRQNADPLLAPLADNGGPTWTHALLPGSPALDAIPEGADAYNGVPASDQRGEIRPSPASGNCDVGAYEHQIPSPEIAVYGAGILIPDGDTTPRITDCTDFGAVLADGGTSASTFTIQNTGDAQLDLGSTPCVTIGGADASDFTLTSDASTPVASGGGTTAFTITFDPSQAGLRTAAVGIANTDGAETPYDFVIQGQGEADSRAIPQGSGASGCGKNRAPVPNAGSDQTVCVGNTVFLDGSATYDPTKGFQPPRSWEKQRQSTPISGTKTSDSSGPLPSFTSRLVSQCWQCRRVPTSSTLQRTSIWTSHPSCRMSRELTSSIFSLRTISTTRFPIGLRSTCLTVAILAPKTTRASNSSGS